MADTIIGESFFNPSLKIKYNDKLYQLKLKESKFNTYRIDLKLSFFNNENIDRLTKED